MVPSISIISIGVENLVFLSALSEIFWLKNNSRKVVFPISGLLFKQVLYSEVYDLYCKIALSFFYSMIYEA